MGRTKNRSMSHDRGCKRKENNLIIKCNGSRLIKDVINIRGATLK